MSIVVVDGKGRIVIPGDIRRKMRLRKGDKLLVVELGDGIVVLKKLDVEELVRSIVEEVARSKVDVESIMGEVEVEANRIARKRIEEILTRH